MVTLDCRKFARVKTPPLNDLIGLETKVPADRVKLFPDGLKSV
jgi:hypothetical protein